MGILKILKIVNLYFCRQYNYSGLCMWRFTTRHNFSTYCMFCHNCLNNEMTRAWTFLSTGAFRCKSFWISYSFIFLCIVHMRTTIMIICGQRKLWKHDTILHNKSIVLSVLPVFLVNKALRCRISNISSFPSLFSDFIAEIYYLLIIIK